MAIGMRLLVIGMRLSPLVALFSISTCHPVFGQAAANKNRPAITADIQLTLVSRAMDGTTLSRTTKGRFVRDAAGRTLLQQGATINISDPVASVSISVDESKKKAVRLQIARPVGAARVPSRSATSSPLPVQRYLGIRDIDGFRSTGTETIHITPAGSPFGNDRPLERVTETWIANDISLPILVIIRDPVSGTLTSQYTNIRVGEEIDSALFGVPAGFAVRERTVATPEK